jgi:GT2 family glycosyltransferase
MTKARNLGAGHAKGKYLVFFDDDIIVHKHCISNIVKPFTDPSVGAVAGRVIEPHKKTEKKNTYVGRITLFGRFTDGFSSTVRQDVDTVMGCSFSVRKDIYEKIGGCDEKFTGNAIREESDLSLRIKEKGYRIVFEPSSLVTHLRAPEGGARKTEGRLSWYYHFFSNETYFFFKHRAWVLVPIILGTRWEWMVRCMFGIGREVSVRSLATPWRGIANGVGKYIKFIKL